jgi:hypothetical protein
MVLFIGEHFNSVPGNPRGLYLKYRLVQKFTTNFCGTRCTVGKNHKNFARRQTNSHQMHEIAFLFNYILVL